ncbi:MAG: hypothetical protein RL329_2454 [Bacteroidota bacterium]|jgi:hypothetical protein
MIRFDLGFLGLFGWNQDFFTKKNPDSIQIILKILSQTYNAIVNPLIYNPITFY